MAVYLLTADKIVCMQRHLLSATNVCKEDVAEVIALQSPD